MSQINKVFVLFVMVFCHVVDDYYLQGILASLKQKKWWEKNYPDRLRINLVIDQTIHIVQILITYTILIV